jgi:hypothetical protein
MKLLLCLAMSLGLSAILYFYMKQKISNIEHRLNTLSDVLQTLTNEFCNKEVKTISNIPLDKSSLYSLPKYNDIEPSDNEREESDDSESESDNDSLPELDAESESGSDTEVDEVVQPKEEIKEKIIELMEVIEPEEIIVVHKESKSLEIDLNESEVTPNLIKVSDDDVLGTKQVHVSVDDYSKLSLKDLKQKVNDLGGPPLKTKQALLNFLKNKV